MFGQQRRGNTMQIFLALGLTTMMIGFTLYIYGLWAFAALTWNAATILWILAYITKNK